jgi:oxygen-independent coproporphyrinogen-3 oxidase
MNSKTFSIYLHFPYCAQRCPYCDFNVHVRKDLPESEFIAALIHEAESKSHNPEWQNKTLQSIFFGGGTPSLFSPDSIATIISALNSIFKFASDIEISLEANPENISADYSYKLFKTGVNRLSLGVQSLTDSYLQSLGRIHSAEKAKEAVHFLKQAGFKNINLDFMFALPQQTLKDFESDLKSALELQPQHFSFYNLTIEKGTHFYQQYSQGKLLLPDDTLASEMMVFLIKTLAASGYQHYEISNFAITEFRSVHNQRYWNMQDYLGLGPGAHSAFLAGKLQMKRYANISDPARYIQSPQEAQAWVDSVEGKNFLFEKLMLGLRLRQSFDLSPIIDDLEKESQLKLLNKVAEFVREGLLEQSGNNIITTLSGLLILDSILSEFASCIGL